jgi:hypothetical protein
MAVFLRHLALGVFVILVAWLLPLILGLRLVLLYFAVVQVFMAGLFVLRRGEWLLGKDLATGQLPVWSYVLWWPFHLVNLLYVFFMTEVRRRKQQVQPTTEILPGWHCGGWFTESAAIAAGVPASAMAVVDLTTEFPERLSTPHYCAVPTWDGTPPTMEQFRRATDFLGAQHAAGRPAVVHCAYGVGRGPAMLIAAFVRLGIADSVDAALAMVKSRRPCVRLNRTLRKALAEWETEVKRMRSSTPDGATVDNKQGR